MKIEWEPLSKTTFVDKKTSDLKVVFGVFTLSPLQYTQ